MPVPLRDSLYLCKALQAGGERYGRNRPYAVDLAAKRAESAVGGAKAAAVKAQGLARTEVPSQLMRACSATLAAGRRTALWLRTTVARSSDRRLSRPSPLRQLATDAGEVVQTAAARNVCEPRQACWHAGGRRALRPRAAAGEEADSATEDAAAALGGAKHAAGKTGEMIQNTATSLSVCAGMQAEGERCGRERRQVRGVSRRPTTPRQRSAGPKMRGQSRGDDSEHSTFSKCVLACRQEESAAAARGSG